MKALLWMIISFVGIVLGFSAFVFFMFFYGCKDTSIWAFISGVLSAMNFHLHYLRWREKLHSWHTVDSLLNIQSFGFVFFVISGAAMLWYIFQCIYFNFDVHLVSKCQQIAAVWAFMTAKYSVSLVYVCPRYIEYILSNALINPSQS